MAGGTTASSPSGRRIGCRAASATRAADHGGRGRDEADEPVDDVRGAERAALGARDPVVERRVVERGKLDRARDVMDARLGVAAGELAEELLLTARERVGDHQQRRDGREGDERPGEVVPAAAGAVGLEHAREHLAAEQHRRGDTGGGERLDHEDGQQLAAPGRPQQPQRAGDDARQLAPRPVVLGRLDVVDREAPHARDPRRTPGGRR
jgi:hypothetical protein